MRPDENQLTQLFENLQGDLTTLLELIVRHKEPLTQANARNASSILRKWLNEEKIGYLANALGVEATVPALNNDAVFDSIHQRTDVEFFMTLGISFNGKPYIGPYYASSPKPEVPIIPSDAMEYEMMRVSKFVKQRRIYFDRQAITCYEIISFVANKLGGVHIGDLRRNEREKFLDRAAHFMMFGGPRDEPPLGCEIYLTLERDGPEILNAFHAEIAAAAGSFIQIHFDGTPVIPIEVRKSLFNIFKNWIGVKGGRQYIFIDC
jgi:hypothetical protein